MQKIRILATAVASMFFLSQCQPDKITTTPSNTSSLKGNIIRIRSDISTNTTWTTGNTYILEKMVAVKDGASLTIEPCVVVKAEKGATGLLISKGAKIFAEGTATCPIVFTSTDDQIKPGEIESPNLGENDRGLWSGLFILGNAPVSSAATSNVLPFLPQQPLYSFGGNEVNDNSGTLKYVSIRHTGHEIARDEVPSGLNLAGVGNTTQLSHIEVFASADDALLLLGGSVKVDYFIGSSFSDDACDVDYGYSGLINHFIGIGGNDKNSSLELDGGEGGSNPVFSIQNSSFVGGMQGEDYIDFQNAVKCKIENSYFTGFGANAIVKLDDDEVADHWLNKEIDLKNIEINISHLSGGNTTLDAIFIDNGKDADQAFASRKPNAKIVTSAIFGADKTAFEKWTVADAKNQLKAL